MASNMGFPANGVENQGWKLYLTSLIMILCAGLFVIARISIRWRSRQLAADDYTIIASLLFSIFLSVTIQTAVVKGYGKHIVDLTKQEQRECLMWFWIAQTPYKIVVALNKTSIVLLYMRIFISRNFRRLCFGALAIVISSGIATVFATILQCIPVQRSWNKAIPGQCIKSTEFWLANAVINILTDCIVLALPIREVFKLQLRLKEKIMLCGVFALGGFVTVTSILRVTAVANSAHNMQDQTWNFIPRGMWTLIEANLGIICACLVVLRQVVKHCIRSVFGTKASTSKQYGYGYGYSGSSRTNDRQPSGIRDFQMFSPKRQGFKLDNSSGSAHEDYEKRTTDTWTGGLPPGHGQSLPMTVMTAHRSTDDAESRKSDEKTFYHSNGSNEDRRSHESSDSGHTLPQAWQHPHTEPPMAIRKQVDVQVLSQPSRIAQPERPRFQV